MNADPIRVDSWFRDIMVSMVKHSFVWHLFRTYVFPSSYFFLNLLLVLHPPKCEYVNSVLALKSWWGYKESFEIWKTNDNTNCNDFVISIPLNFNFLHKKLFLDLLSIMFNCHSRMLFYYLIVHHWRHIWPLFFQQKKEDILVTSIQTRSKAHDIIRRMLASLGDPYTRFLSPAEVTSYSIILVYFYC